MKSWPANDHILFLFHSIYSDAEYHTRNQSFSNDGFANGEQRDGGNILNQNERSTSRNRNDATNYRRYNWTDIERVDSTDLQAKLKNLKPYTQYEILLQAFNQYGRGPVAKIEAFTAGDGKNSPHINHVFYYS